MKFKVGDIIKDNSNSKFEYKILNIKNGYYFFKDKYYWNFKDCERNCSKVNHWKTKLGKILYK